MPRHEQRLHIHARDSAQARRDELGVPHPQSLQERASVELDANTITYLFRQQVELEHEGAAKGGGMDYTEYAKRMWEHFMEIRAEGETFEQFRKNLISYLHGIEMHRHVYEEVKAAMPDLIRKYAGQVREIALWSTGDVSGTAYQSEKIYRSQIIPDFYKDLRSTIDKRERKDLFRNRTIYLVGDDKFALLQKELSRIAEADPTGAIKVVVIEDSRNNFTRIQSLIDSMGETAERIEFIPIWATYSREGQTAEQRAAGDEAKVLELEQQKKDLNAISSFTDLSDSQRFEALLNDSFLFIDFDGVISDNIAMRKEQVKAKYYALRDALGDEWRPEILP